MSRPVFGVVDIGTNSCLLLVARVDTHARVLQVLADITRITQLGRGFYGQGALQEDAIARTVRALEEFADRCRRMGVVRRYATGTSVLREATNGARLLDLAEDRLGVRPEVIDGEEEARLSYLAVRLDGSLPLTQDGPLAVVDVGGGSTEVVVGRGEPDYRASLRLGSVRVTERFFRADPPAPEELEEARRSVAATLAPVAGALEGAAVCVGVGGTVVTLANVARYRLGNADPRALHGFRLTAPEVERQIRQYASCSLVERMRIPGLEPKRARAILGGALIVRELLRHCVGETLRASLRGLRYGVLWDRLLGTTAGPWRIDDRVGFQEGFDTGHPDDLPGM